MLSFEKKILQDFRAFVIANAADVAGSTFHLKHPLSSSDGVQSSTTSTKLAIVTLHQINIAIKRKKEREGRRKVMKKMN